MAEAQYADRGQPGLNVAMEREDLKAGKLPVLQKYFGYSAFRPGQDALIDGILEGRDVFGIMPTGGGKSLCYQVPGLLLPGITLVVSPLISLMRDQVMSLKAVGIAGAYINSTLNAAQIRAVYRNLEAGMYKIVYVAPERLEYEGFQAVAARLPISLLAVDEAHCISQWGQDFRPSYLKIPEFVEALPRRPILAAFTATATRRVQEDIIRDLDLHRPRIIQTGFDRPNLYFEVQHPLHKEDALLPLVEKFRGKAGIIYCSTRKTVESVCTQLQSAGYPATRYHAGLEEEERTANQEDFLYDRKSLMVATNAFGMGIDKPNVRFVIHYQMPKSLEAYYQEAGRAGRDGEPAQCILLYSPQDVSIAKCLINNASENSELTPSQQEQVRIQELRRLDAMIRYCTTDLCLRSHILSYFGENAPEVCGNCGSCRGKYESADITSQSKILLSAVEKIFEKGVTELPLSTLLRVLQGYPVPQVTENGLQNLPFYGRFKNTGSSEIRSVAESLCREGCLRLEGSRQLIRLTDSAQQVLDGTRSITVLRKKPQQEAPAEEIHNTLLMDALKELRRNLAQKAGIPPETVFSEISLREMEKKRPKTPTEFRKITGVGRDPRQLVRKGLYCPDQKIRQSLKKTEEEKSSSDFYAL